jgi:hypothetical protein
METVEIVVYMAAALIIGSLIYYFVGTAGFGDLFDDLMGKRSQEFRKVDAEGFVTETLTFWQSCGLGEVSKNLTLYVTGEGEMNQSLLFSSVKKLNHCQTLQSASQGCGSIEQVSMQTFSLPHIIRLQCNATSQMLIIR